MIMIIIIYSYSFILKHRIHNLINLINLKWACPVNQRTKFKGCLYVDHPVINILSSCLFFTRPSV